MKLAAIAALLALPSAAFAQLSDVSPEGKFAWAENLGWINCRDAGDPEASAGLALLSDHLGGWLWSENAGWVSLGQSYATIDGPYANTSGLNFGVNLDPVTGRLSGYAWGENIGWINFGAGALATPPRPARLDAPARRLRGCAWGENVGWISFDDGTWFVSIRCPSDYNANSFVNGADFDEFVTDFEAGLQRADYNRDSYVNGADFDEFVIAFEAGC